MYNFMFFDYHCDTITAIKKMNMSILLKGFLLPLFSFSLPPLLTHIPYPQVSIHLFSVTRLGCIFWK